MKKIRVGFTLVILLLCILIMTSCAKTAPTPVPTPTPAPQGQNTSVTTNTYIGTATCKICHANKFEVAELTKHFQSFKPLSSYPTTVPLGPITIFDGDNKDKPTSTTIDLSKAKVYGVMVNDYIIAEIPATAGFKGKLYRVAAVKKSGDKWTIGPASEEDVNKDGKPDWIAGSFPCGSCHAPGIATGSPDYGMTCEGCHGPAGNHAKSADKKGTMDSNFAKKSCLGCHNGNPEKDKTGIWVTNNHYGTRDFFANKHADSSQLNGCLTCHGVHKANAKGKLLRKDAAADICKQCHAELKLDPDKLMWKNPTDPRGHITKDHSFGIIPYKALGDDPKTKPIEITNQKTLDMIKEKLPQLFE